ncbi:MAG: YlmC/YmxH family sporulation protein [Bacillota bacterium]|nr:YlmC/YmxH family sporulation protein [Bacillota bacterium]
MTCRVVEIRHKEVINKKDGSRLGFVDDVEVDTLTAKVVALVIYGRLRWFGLLGRCDDIIICWDNIELIGEDTILVSFECEPRKHKRFKLPFTF